MCDTLHSPARLALRLRVDVASASELLAANRCRTGARRMSARFAAKRLARLCADAQRSVESTDHADTLAVIDGEDIDAASRSPARLLITASTQQSIETLARRIHGNGLRAEFPFVVTAAGELPVGAPALRKACV